MVSEETIQEIREYLDYPAVRFDEAMHMLNRLLPSLLDEYAAMRKIVQAVAADQRWVVTIDDSPRAPSCMWCGSGIGHQVLCPVTEARTLLAKHE